MRSFGSLLKAGYEPRRMYLWKMGETEPYLEFCRWQDYASTKPRLKREAITKPYNRPYNPFELYIHKYLPKQEIKQVKIIKPLPYCKVGFRYKVEDGLMIISDRVVYTTEDIYNYPSFFQPMYDEFEGY